MGTNVYVKYWVIHVPPKHVEGPLTSKSGSDRSEKGKESGIAQIGGILTRDGTLLWIYRRLIGRSYIALARQDQYIGNISDPLIRLRS